MKHHALNNKYHNLNSSKPNSIFPPSNTINRTQSHTLGARNIPLFFISSSTFELKHRTLQFHMNPKKRPMFLAVFFFIFSFTFIAFVIQYVLEPSFEFIQ